MTQRTHGALYDSEAALRLVDSTLHDLTGVSSDDVAGSSSGPRDGGAECRELLAVLAAVRARLDGALFGASTTTGDLVRDQLAQARAGLYQAERRLWALARPAAAEDESTAASAPSASL